MFIRHAPLWLRPQKWKPAVPKRKNGETKTSWESENSPRLCLLALESLRASPWPMELRKIIASTTSPSCIVLVAFLATQGPPLRPDGAGTWRASSIRQVKTFPAWRDDPFFFLLTPPASPLPTPLFLSFFCACLFHSRTRCIRKSVKWGVMLRSHVQTSPRHSTPSHWW